VDFVWDAPAECPTAASILVEVSKLSASNTSAQRWRARGTVTRVQGAWALHLSTDVDGRRDAREFTAPACADLAAAAAVVLAVAIAPPPIVAAAPAPDAPVAPPAVPSAPPPVAPAPALPLPSTAHEHAHVAESPTAPSRARAFTLSADGAASAGVLATPAFGLALGVAWVPPKVRIELDALWFPRSVVTGSPGIEGTFSLLGAAARGCWMPIDGRVRVGPCAGLQLGAINASASGAAVTQSLPVTEAWFAVTAGALLSVRLLRHIAARAAVDGIVPLTRKDFDVSGQTDTLHRSSPVSVETTIGVEVQIP